MQSCNHPRASALPPPWFPHSREQKGMCLKLAPSALPQLLPPGCSSGTPRGPHCMRRLWQRSRAQRAHTKHDTSWLLGVCVHVLSLTPRAPRAQAS